MLTQHLLTGVKAVFQLVPTALLLVGDVVISFVAAGSLVGSHQITTRVIDQSCNLELLTFLLV